MSGLRGRTRRGRLQQLDRWLCATEPALVGRQGRVLDVGLGDEPWTTVELAEAVDAEVIGLDAVASRVATARRLAPEHRFEVGEWTGGQREATVVRAMNVVRQLTPAEVPAAHARLGQALRPGGIVLEGSCSHTGDCLVAHVLRRREALVAEAMVFATTFARGFAPRMYLHQLPRDLRKRARHAGRGDVARLAGGVRGDRGPGGVAAVGFRGTAGGPVAGRGVGARRGHLAPTLTSVAQLAA